MPDKTPKPRKDGARFEAFLQKQFSALKQELAPHTAQATKKEGKVLSFETRIDKRPKRRSTWKYGIAAAILVGVAVPMVLQLNQEKSAHLQQATAPIGGTELEKPSFAMAPKSEGNKADQDEADKAGVALNNRVRDTEKEYFKSDTGKNKKTTNRKTIASDDLVAGERSVPTLKATREEAKLKDLPELAAPAPAEDARITNSVREGDANAFAAKKEAERSGYAMADEAPASSPKSASPASTAAGAAPSAPRGRPLANAAPKENAAEIKARSVAIDDAKTRLQRQDIKEDEKAEMERLWKEFEKNPDSFNKDKKRSGRLRVLLSRYNEKSRAKRMRTIEAH